jgi:antitoxin ParD1/3/4
MKIFHISLPDSLGKYIEEQVVNEGYENVNEYFKDLVEKEKKRKYQARLEFILEGFKTEKICDMTEEEWQEIHEAVQERFRKEKTPENNR